MLESEIVAARRAYAASLGVTLSGAISNADEPVHIHHAVSNSNHNPNASNRINLGRARAYKERREEGDYFFIDTSIACITVISPRLNGSPLQQPLPERQHRAGLPRDCKRVSQ